jgi:hypothetical protein
MQRSKLPALQRRLTLPCSTVVTLSLVSQIGLTRSQHYLEPVQPYRIDHTKHHAVHGHDQETLCTAPHSNPRCKAVQEHTACR